MGGILPSLIGLGLLLVLSAFFSGSETAVCALNRLQRDRLAGEPKSSSRAITAFLDDPRRFFITILLGNTFVNITFATLTASLIYGLLGSSPSGMAIGGATVVITLCLLVFGEITPKTFALRHAERFSRVTSRPLWGFSILIFPLRRILRAITDLLLPLFGVGSLPPEDLITRDDLQAMIEHRGGNRLHADEREILGRILELRDTVAREIMVPRTELVAMRSTATIAQVLERAKQAGHSRIPLYRDRIDNVCGVLRVKDWMQWRQAGVRQLTVDQFLALPRRAARGGMGSALIYQPFFVPETRTIVDLLPELTRMRAKLAVVVDEHGGVAGCLTIEDIVEEVVGEIVDEYDTALPEEVVQRSDDPLTYDVEGQVSVRRLNRTIGLHLDEGAADTIGGYLLALLGHIPTAGEVRKDERGVRFEIREVRGRRIVSVSITLPPTGGSER